jgi:hypothetical protein
MHEHRPFIAAEPVQRDHRHLRPSDPGRDHRSHRVPIGSSSLASLDEEETWSDTPLFRGGLNSARLCGAEAGSRVARKRLGSSRAAITCQAGTAPPMPFRDWIDRFEVKLPVMMVTAYGDDERRRRAAEYGAADFLAKPVDFEHLKAQLRQLPGVPD